METLHAFVFMYCTAWQRFKLLSIIPAVLKLQGRWSQNDRHNQSWSMSFNARSAYRRQATGKKDLTQWSHEYKPNVCLQNLHICKTHSLQQCLRYLFRRVGKNRLWWHSSKLFRDIVLLKAVAHNDYYNETINSNAFGWEIFKKSMSRW